MVECVESFSGFDQQFLLYTVENFPHFSGKIGLLESVSLSLFSLFGICGVER